MSTKLCIANLLISAFILLHYGAVGYVMAPESEEFKKHYNEELAKAKKYKHPRCFEPDHQACNIPDTLFPPPDAVAIRWFFSPIYKTCTPLYVPSTQKILCSDLSDLPITKKECDDLCGEPCTVTHGNKKTEPGVCMFSYHCHIFTPRGVKNTCEEYALCCPRGYEYPTTTFVPRTERPRVTPFRMDAIVMNIDHP